MVVKQKHLCLLGQAKFESSVNSYGGKTSLFSCYMVDWFESSVNSYGGKTVGS